VHQVRNQYIELILSVSLGVKNKSISGFRAKSCTFINLENKSRWNLRVKILWDITSCHLVNSYGRSEGMKYLYLQDKWVSDVLSLDRRTIYQSTFSQDLNIREYVLSSSKLERWNLRRKLFSDRQQFITPVHGTDLLLQ